MSVELSTHTTRGRIEPALVFKNDALQLGPGVASSVPDVQAVVTFKPTQKPGVSLAYICFENADHTLQTSPIMEAPTSDMVGPGEDVCRHGVLIKSTKSARSEPLKATSELASRQFIEGLMKRYPDSVVRIERHKHVPESFEATVEFRSGEEVAARLYFLLAPPNATFFHLT